jgi:hypothetical protein
MLRPLLDEVMARFGTNPLHANREAQARWYARQKRGEASYRCDVGPKVLEMLVWRGYLQDDETDDPHEVAKAISVFLSDHAEADHQAGGKGRW